MERRPGQRVDAAIGSVERQCARTGGFGESGIRVSDGGAHREWFDGPVLHVDVAAAALNLPQVTHELLPAGWQVDILLDVLPVDPEQAGVDLQPVVEERVLAADFVAPQAVGRILSRYVPIAVRAERHADALQIAITDGA